jgi:hypothetical protein
MRWGTALLFATLIQHQNLRSRARWATVAPGYRQIVRYLLDRATGRNAR